MMDLVIWYWLTICQLNQFNTNSEAAMLSMSQGLIHGRGCTCEQGNSKLGQGSEQRNFDRKLLSRNLSHPGRRWDRHMCESKPSPRLKHARVVHQTWPKYRAHQESCCNRLFPRDWEAQRNTEHGEKYKMDTSEIMIEYEDVNVDNDAHQILKWHCHTSSHRLTNGQ